MQSPSDYGTGGGRSDGGMWAEDPDKDDPTIAEGRRRYQRHLTREWKRRNRYPTTRLGRTADEALRMLSRRD